MVTFPPLHMLKVFESVARQGQLRGTAAELNITIGAVSHQLKALQEHLGVALFEKQGRRLVLTERGARLQRAVSRGLADFGQGIRDVLNDDAGEKQEATLRLFLPPILTSTWMSLRIFAFLEDNPHIRLKMEFGIVFEAIDWRRTDAAIVYGNPPWPGLWWRMLHGIRLMPFCSPRLLHGLNPIRLPSDVLAHRLLHEDDGTEWRRWLAQARLPYPGPPDVQFNDFGMILQAARDGHGVALVDDVVTARDVDEGRLVQALSLSVPAAKNYHCLCMEENLSNPAIGLFIDWLVEQSETQMLRLQFTP
ncbi:LysR substrate-binding domain-containing protein [Rhizobium ruizarguesonis]